MGKMGTECGIATFSPQNVSRSVGRERHKTEGMNNEKLFTCKENSRGGIFRGNVRFGGNRYDHRHIHI